MKGLSPNIPTAGAWSHGDDILFSSPVGDGLRIVRVNDSGGEVTPVTTLDTAKDLGHTFPIFLPDGRRFWYFAWSRTSSPPLIDIVLYAGSLDSKSGVYLRPLEQNVNPGGATLAGHIHATGSSRFRVERGVVRAANEDRRQITSRHIRSACRKRLAFSASERVLVYRHAAAGADQPLAVNQPAWFDREIAFASLSEPTGAPKLFRRSSVSVGGNTLLFDGNPAASIRQDWSSDDKYVVFVRRNALDATVQNLWYLPLSGDRKPLPYVESQSVKTEAQLSPDNHWLAYATNESGTYQIVVQSFPDPKISRSPPATRFSGRT